VLSLNQVITVGIVLILILLVVIFLIPTDGRRGKEKRRRGSPEDNKDWKAAALSLEKFIHSQKKQIESLERNNKALDKRETMEKYINKKLHEKLQREKEWHKKNEVNVGRKSKDLLELKNELVSVQENSAKEYALNLELKKKYQDIEGKLSLLQSERRAAEIEQAQSNTKIQKYRMEIAQLKKENAELTKKEDGTTWIAKSEYAKLKNLLKEKEVELQRVIRENRKT